MSELVDRLAAAIADRYKIEREIGAGGMATVYLARDLKHGREVALKVLRPDLAVVVGADRFLREIRITASLNHPHILPLLDSGEADGLVFFVTPFQPEGSLRSRLAREGRIERREVVRIARQVASALDYAHGHAVIHRDVKPENILFSEGLAVVSDFGVARALSSAGRDTLTRSGFPVGTLGYMSPEQAAGRIQVDESADVYGLGSVIYEMLIGDTPGMWPADQDLRMGRFAEASPDHRRHLDALPGRVEQCLVRALALRPTDRYASPGEFVEALAAAVEGSQRLSDTEVRGVLERAAAIEADSLSGEPNVSMGGIERAAAQVGIPPDVVREAARDLAHDSSPPAVPTATRFGTMVFQKSRLKADRVVDGEVPESTHIVLVDEIQSSLGIAGHVSRIGGTLSWSPAAPGVEDRKVVVTIAPLEGRTAIHVEERFELSGWRMFAPGWGVGAGIVLALLLTLLLGLTPDHTWPFILVSGIGGAIIAANAMVKVPARRRAPELAELADRLAILAADAASSGLDSGSGGSRLSPGG
jgi:hypothetical protein